MLPCQAQICKRMAAVYPQTRTHSPVPFLKQYRPAAQLQARAQPRRDEAAQQVESLESDAEAARIAELEGGRRRKKGKGRQNPQPGSFQSVPLDSNGFANWPEGQLLPDGWDNMTPIQRAGEVWSGKRGALFWANKAAWASVFIVGGAWVLFRIVGPITGLYTLKNDLLSPPNL